MRVVLALLLAASPAFAEDAKKDPAPAGDPAGPIVIVTDEKPKPHDLGPPTLVLGPTLATRFPYALAALGVFAYAYVPSAFSMYFQAQYGPATGDFPDGTWLAATAELYGGYPIYLWNSPSPTRVMLDAATFTTVEATLHQSITIEGGVLTGRMGFLRPIEATDSDGTIKTFALPFERRVTTFAVGARYLRAVNTELGGKFPSVHSYSAAWLHLLVRGPGAPDGVFHRGASFDVTRATNTFVGFQLGTTLNFTPDQWTPLEASVAYVPGGVGISAQVGISLPFWVL